MTDLPVTKADDDLVERVTDELLAHGEFSSSGNNRPNARIAAEVVIEMATKDIRAQLAAAEAERDKWVKHHEAAIKSIEAQTARLSAAEAQLQAMRKALEEIAEGKGRYSQDRYEHACNTIEDMKELARESLRSLTEGAGKC